MSTRVRQKLKTDTSINLLELRSFSSSLKSHPLWVTLYVDLILASYRLYFLFYIHDNISQVFNALNHKSRFDKPILDTGLKQMFKLWFIALVWDSMASGPVYVCSMYCTVACTVACTHCFIIEKKIVCSGAIEIHRIKIGL